MAQRQIVVREASTVLVFRDEELLMVRRSARSAFMPDTYVFPGGAIEREDGPAGSDATYAQAARRECREEAAVELPRDRPLRWFDTWKTPSGESSRRFLARFFYVKLDAHEAGHTRHDGQETTDSRFVLPATILEAWERSEIDLPPPTLSILLRLRTHGIDDLAASETEDGDTLHVPILPKVVPSSDPAEIVMPHDPRYPHLPGDSEAVPARCHRYPRSFRREGSRWRAL